MGIGRDVYQELADKGCGHIIAGGHSQIPGCTGRGGGCLRPAGCLEHESTTRAGTHVVGSEQSQCVTVKKPGGGRKAENGGQQEVPSTCWKYYNTVGRGKESSQREGGEIGCRENRGGSGGAPHNGVGRQGKPSGKQPRHGEDKRVRQP